MGTQPGISPRIVFGPYEYEDGSGDLRKHGHRIRLQGQPLQVLAILLRHPGDIISREELQRQVWGGAGFGDFEHGLNAAVNKLRQALGDSADQPRYIETVPGRGYRFVAPILKPSTKAVLGMPPPVILRAGPAATAPSRRWPLWLAGVGLLAAAGGYWLGVSRGPRVPPAAPARFTVSPPPDFVLEGASSRQAFALSPDGRRLAFTAMNASGRFSVFVRDFDALAPRLIAGSEGAHTLFFAPDSRSLYLTVRAKLLRVELAGGAVAVLGNVPARIFSGAFIDPGTLLLGGALATHQVSSSGGQPEPLREVYRWPQVLPGGRNILHSAWDEANDRHLGRVTRFGDPSSTRDVSEGDSRILYAASAADAHKGHLLYVRAGNLMARPFDIDSLSVTGEATPIANKVYSFRPTGAADFSVSGNGVLAYQSFVSRSQLAFVDRQGRQVSSIGPPNINVKSGRLSPDGRKLCTAIYDVERGAQSLWVFDIATGAGRLLIPDSSLRDAPVWNPDSNRLAFLKAHTNRLPGIALRGLGEKDAERMLPAGGFQLPTDWSPDGRFVVFSDSPSIGDTPQSDVWVADLARGQDMSPLLNSPFDEANAAFSPDGKWLAFTSNESGRPEVYLQSFTASPSPGVVGERHLVSRSGALALRWRRDGKELFYLGYDGRVHAVPVTLAARPVMGPAKALFAISTAARAAVHSLIGFDVSADGSRFLIPVVTSPENPVLVVVQNWDAELRR